MMTRTRTTIRILAHTGVCFSPAGDGDAAAAVCCGCAGGGVSEGVAGGGVTGAGGGVTGGVCVVGPPAGGFVWSIYKVFQDLRKKSSPSANSVRGQP